MADFKPIKADSINTAEPSSGQSGSLVDYVFDMLLAAQEQNYAMCMAISSAIKEIEEKDEKSTASWLMEVMKQRFERTGDLEHLRGLLLGRYESRRAAGAGQV